MELDSKSDNQMIARAIACMEEDGVLYKEDGKPNVPELMRRAGISRQRARTIAAHGFRQRPHGNAGSSRSRVMTESEKSETARLLAKGVTNSSVIFRILVERHGYAGSVSTIKRFRAAHRDLIPSPRFSVAKQGSRSRRYETAPGHMYQMDWGFINVLDTEGKASRYAVFAMVCHHCGMVYIEFFTNARQENLFIGMVHAFLAMGVPEVVLTDNMASVSNRRDPNGIPIINTRYEAFQKACGFTTRLCRPRHPFTKGKVERLVRFVKENFVPARTFHSLTDLNGQAERWCGLWNSKPHRSTGFTPVLEHAGEGLRQAREENGLMDALIPYTAPLRLISVDGFVTYEGRMYGVPFSYEGRSARVMRNGDELSILDETCSFVVCRHSVDWSHRPHYCIGQFEEHGPEESPTSPVVSFLNQYDEPGKGSPLARFDFKED